MKTQEYENVPPSFHCEEYSKVPPSGHAATAAATIAYRVAEKLLFKGGSHSQAGWCKLAVPGPPL